MKILNNVTTTFKYFASILVVVLGLTINVQAAGSAQLYLTPASGTYTSGQTFTTDVKIKSDTNINALTVKLSYPLDKLSVTGLSYNNSAFAVQAESKASEGTIVMSRAVVKPITGDNLVATITFVAKSGSGSAAVNFDKSSVVVNNGVAVASTQTGANYNFSGGGSVANPTPTNGDTNVDVNAGNPNASTKLVVVDSNGKPVKDATVTIDGITKKTNTKGEVVFELSLGQKTATIKYGNKTDQKTFALGIATSSDNPTEIKSQVNTGKSNKFIAPIIGTLILIALIIGLGLFVYYKYKKLNKKDTPVNEDTILPTANNIARKSLNETPKKGQKSDLKKDEPIDKLEQPPK